MKVEPECITWSPQYVTNRLGLSKQARDPVGGAVMMLRGQKHIQGADFIFSIFHKGFSHILVGLKAQLERISPHERQLLLTHMALLAWVHVHIHSNVL